MLMVLETHIEYKVIEYGHKVEYELKVDWKREVVKKIMAVFNH